MTTISTPCVRLCKLNAEQVCIGCGRTKSDIMVWTHIEETDRKQLMEEAKSRLKQMEGV